MKAYVKPELYYENFEVSQHIAGCNLTLQLEDPIKCTAIGEIGSDNLSGWFVDANTSCAVKVESYCYTNGSVSVTTINS